MTQKQLQILNEFNSFIKNKIIEGDFEGCILLLARDTSEILVNGANANLAITQQVGRIIIP